MLQALQAKLAAAAAELQGQYVSIMHTSSVGGSLQTLLYGQASSRTPAPALTSRMFADRLCREHPARAQAAAGPTQAQPVECA